MSLFTCPICQSPLSPATDSWQCDGSLSTNQQTDQHSRQTLHSFDVARQGYVNLLPVQQKKSKQPGDSLESIIARQRFLQAGYYQPLQALICQQIDSLLSNKQAEIEAEQQKTSINWLDIGCGEGYYTQAIAQIESIDQLIAADISKPAVLAVAKASKLAKRLWLQNDHNSQAQSDNKKTAIYPIVTSAANLPLSTNSITGISSIFSPILPDAFAQVLADKGYLIIAKPDIGHLASVREALFDEVREHNSDKFLAELAPLFELIQTQYVSTELSLPAVALEDLLTMTPYAYRAQPEKRQALMKMTETEDFQTQTKFVIYVLQMK